MLDQRKFTSDEFLEVPRPLRAVLGLQSLLLPALGGGSQIWPSSTSASCTSVNMYVNVNSDCRCISDINIPEEHHAGLQAQYVCSVIGRSPPLHDWRCRPSREAVDGDQQGGVPEDGGQLPEARSGREVHGGEDGGGAGSHFWAVQHCKSLLSISTSHRVTSILSAETTFCIWSAGRLPRQRQICAHRVLRGSCRRRLPPA